MSLVAVAAGQGLCVPPVSELGKILGIDVVCHPNHEARRLLHGVGVGSEVHTFCLRIFFVAIPAWGADCFAVVMHERPEIFAGDIFGQSCEIHWPGTCIGPGA